MVALAVLVFAGVGSVTGFMFLNRRTSDNRDMTAARELCQERIEQVMTLPFNPASGSMPMVIGQDGQTYYLLGQVGDYDASRNYAGKNGNTSSTYNPSGEAVVVYKTPNGNGLVTGYRTTLVESVGVPSLVRFTVAVNYTVRGTTKNYTLYTLRSLD